MRTTFHLRVWTRFLAPPEEVWKLKTDPDALAAEFRPYFTLRADRDALDRGLRGDLPMDVRARLCPGMAPVGLAWPMRLESAREGEAYVDTSQNRLYTRFEHHHLVEPTPDGARYVDAVTFVPATLNKVTAILTRRLFVHRHRVAARRLPADPQVVGVSVLRVMVEEEESAA